jgi:4-hydroxybenzoate polyprenyltransferase
MTGLLQFYRYLNILSVDVAAGAVCSALFFARILNVTILPYGLIALGLTVWIIYTLDHLLDARKVKRPAATRRHQFHQEHFHVLVRIVVLAIMIDGVLIFFLRKQVFIGGIVLALLVGIYFFIHRYVKFLKEIFIAVLYTVGVLLPSASVTGYPWNGISYLLIVQFTLTALINLLIFSWFDHEKDLKDGNTSFVTVVGEKQSRMIIVLLFVVVPLLTPFTGLVRASLVIVMMNLMLLVIFRWHTFFAKNDRFRLLGDAVFFIPLLYLLL